MRGGADAGRHGANATRDCSTRPRGADAGLVPVIHQLVCCGKDLRSQETTEDMKNLLSQKVCIEVVINEWVPKRLMKLYMDFCDKSTEAQSHKLLKKLYNLEVSEDEVIVSDCSLQDRSILSFLHALEVHKTIALLDISHNSLGNETMKKIQQIFTSSNQKYGGLTLDLHCNRFGPTTLFQICECPVMFKRLEVLNLSQNRLTDACPLYNLKIEQCSLTSRTIQKLADCLHGGSDGAMRLTEALSCGPQELEKLDLISKQTFHNLSCAYNRMSTTSVLQNLHYYSDKLLITVPF
ncbi:hypothetical protein KFK09_004572 [Dendrobium nobile]|uniref:Uncharacterized protein n=1 Tax=Dendrobium nobile TaxID=94219 RepID=A0A8T3C4F5_DENNO|nr:hypothetical protein KFK09_004572 [Dendrobium nobile]